RNTYPALASGTIELPEWFDDASADDKQVMAFYRTAGSEKLLVFHNVSDTPSTYTFTAAIDRPIADMNGVKIASQGDTHTLEMPAYSSIVIQL
ncbi:MAG: alpha-glucosidase C-terminal domain-containing protein, partial [Alistipes sp.]|nr:alpha-glucosidase C-terminal domain-containing protein [Alistipes sp.]